MVLSEQSQMSLSSSSWDSSESRVKISTVAAFLPLPAACPRKWRFPGPAWLQRVMALTTLACDHSFSEAPLLHTAINSCRLSSSRATRFLSFRQFSSEKPRSTVAVWLGRTSTTCRRTCSSGNRARPSHNLPMSSRKDFGWKADGLTKSNQSSHSFLSCSSGCSFNSPSRFGATRTRWSLRALARVAISASPKSSKSSGQVIGLWPRGCSGWVLVAGWDGERISTSSRSSSLSAGPEGCRWLSAAASVPS